MASNSLKESYIRGMKAEKKQGKVGEKELGRVTIKEADNGGFVIECQYKMKPKEEKGGMMSCGMGYEEKEFVAKDFDGLVEILDDMFGG